MRNLCAIVVLLVPMAAGAQTLPVRAAAAPASTSYQAYQNGAKSMGNANSPQVLNGDQDICLMRKSSGRTECHTYAEWVVIARNIKPNR